MSMTSREYPLERNEEEGAKRSVEKGEVMPTLPDDRSVRTSSMHGNMYNDTGSGISGFLKGVLFNHNPFYLISAALVLYGLNVMFRSQDAWQAPWAIFGLTWFYTFLVGLAVCGVMRLRVVWDDVRSILVVLLVLFMTNSVSIDDVGLDRPGVQPLFAVGSLLLTIAISELVFRVGRLRLRGLIRFPYYGILTAFYVFPLGLTQLLWRGPEHINSVYWGICLFPVVIALLLLSLLPAIYKGKEYTRENGTPYRWPWFPWLAFGLLLAGAAARTYLLCISYFPANGTEHPFGLYLIIPLVFSAALLLLEMGRRERHAGIQYTALVLPVLAVIMVVPQQIEADSLYLRFLMLYADRLGTPFLLTIGASAIFYLWATLRGVKGAMVCLLGSLMLLSCVNHEALTLSISPFIYPPAWILWLLAGVFAIPALLRRSAILGVMAVFITCVSAVTQAVELEVGLKLPAGIAATIMLVVLMVTGIVCEERYRRVLQNSAALLALALSTFAMCLTLSSAWAKPATPGLMFLYTLVLTGLVCWYGMRIHNIYFFLLLIFQTMLLVTRFAMYGWRHYGAIDWPDGFAVLLAGGATLIAGVCISLLKSMVRSKETTPLDRIADRFVSCFPDFQLLEIRERLKAIFIGLGVLYAVFLVMASNVPLVTTPIPRRANAAECHVSLVQIHGALQAYRQDHDGKWPDVEGQHLIRALHEYLGAHEFHCPSDTTPVDNGNQPYSSYGYRPPTAGAKSAPETPIAWDREPLHSGKRHVLTVDGGVCRISKSAWDEYCRKWGIR